MNTIRGLDKKKIPREIRTDSEGRVIVSSEGSAPPIVAMDTASITALAPEGLVRSDLALSYDISASSTSKELPTKNGTYLLVATGNTAFVQTGYSSGPTVDHTAGNFSFPVPEGAPIVAQLAGDYISFIGVSATGYLSVIPIER